VRHRLTRRADEDIAHLLQETFREFGPHQVRIYAALIDRAMALVAEDPERPSSKDRSDLADGVRSFHVALASGRTRGASHVLYFTVVEHEDRSREVLILRVLHDRMEPRPRLTPDGEPVD
jgi:toxin ParE1/3/4